MEVLGTKKVKEKTFNKGDFELSIRINDSFLFLEALNLKTNIYYTSFLTNKTIEDVTQHLFSNVDDLYEVLLSSLEAKNNSQPNGLYVKFNKKEVYIFMKIEFNSPIKKISSFYIYLKPQVFGAPSKKIHSQIEELDKKVSQIEKIMESHNFLNIHEKIKKVESFLETRNMKKNDINDFNEPEPSNSQNLNKSNKKPELNGETHKNIEGLTFDPTKNLKYFKFKENNKVVTRNAFDKKLHILAWTCKPLDKKRMTNQYFTVKIEKLNKESEIINACVGVMADEGPRQMDNLSKHNGEGCYLYGIGTQFFWINNVKTKTNHKYGYLNDLIKVSVNFANKKIRWTVNDIDIGFGDFEEQQINKYEFYPVVTMAFNKDSVRIEGYMFD